MSTSRTRGSMTERYLLMPRGINRYLVNFLSGGPDPDVARALLGEDHSPEAIAIEGSEVYVWTPDGVKAMTLSSAYLERRFGVVATARNWNTLQKIVARF